MLRLMAERHCNSAIASICSSAKRRGKHVSTIVNKRGLLPADTTHRQAAPRSGTSKPESREPRTTT
jgi:hypothetical protein